MIDCPDTDKLLQLLDEKLSQEAYRDLEAHLEGCSRCREALEGLTAGAAAVLQSRLGPAPCVLAALDHADEQGLSTHVAPDTSERLTSPHPDGPVAARDTPTMPTAATARAMSRVAGRNMLLGEIGRGGMGRVFEGRDPDLGRPLAVKVLLESHRDNPEMVRRFRDEVQIHAQLQHPGVVPIYELGALPDGCPFFTMKLVQGQTLSELLGQRAGPHEDLPRFLTVFEQIAQTLAHAHSRRVIHRDLKPSNVMVGPFGEVQVMDWGLAKVLSRGEDATGQAFPPDGDTAGTIYTARLADLSRGALGTLGFMPPEQANGRVDEVDERADVFGLGGILCDMLTGQPPYAGRDFDEVLQLTRRGDVTGAFARLDNYGADAELVSLCKECLAPDCQRRPRHAGVVAERMGAYQAGVRERLRAAELERAAAQAREQEAMATAAAVQARALAERQARRRTVGMAAALLGLVVVAGGAGVWFQWHRAELRQAVGEALVKQTELREAGRWPEARTVLEQAQARLGGVGPADLRQQVQQALDGLDLLNRLEKVRLRKATIVDGQFDYASADRDYAKELEAAGLATVGEDAAVVAARVQVSPLRVELVAFLDDWADATTDEGRRTWLLTVARQADGDAGRSQFHDAVLWNDPQALEQRLKEVDVGALSPHLLAALARSLPVADKVSFLTKAQQRKPDDFWLNFLLGAVLQKGKPEEAVGYYRAALAVRPGTSAVYNNLGAALDDQGRYEEAEAAEREAIRLDPNYANAHTNLGVALGNQGRYKEAEAACREAIRLEPDNGAAHNNLGAALNGQGRFKEGEAAFREAIRLKPNLPEAHKNLGGALRRQGRHQEAEAAYREAIRLKPDIPEAHYDLGGALNEQGRYKEGEAAFREAIRLKPNYPEAHNILGATLFDQGRYKASEAACREAIRLKPDNHEAHNHLGAALFAQSQYEASEAACREAIRLKPDFPEAHNNLGGALNEQGRYKEGEAAFREALRLKPDYPEAHYNLGGALNEQRRYQEAEAALREAIRLKPDYPEAHYNLGIALQGERRYQEAEAACREAIRLKPDYPEAHNNLGNALHSQGRYKEAEAALREAIRLKPNFPLAHYNLGNSLFRQLRLDEAIQEYRQAIALDRKLAAAHMNLGSALGASGQPDEAIKELRLATTLDANNPAAQCNLGIALKDRGRLDEAIQAQDKAITLDARYGSAHGARGEALLRLGRFAEADKSFRRCLELLPQQDPMRPVVGRLLQKCERQLALDQKLAAVLRGDAEPAGVQERLDLAQFCLEHKRLFVTSARFYTEVIVARPELVADPGVGCRYDAARAAALAGCGQGEDAAKLDDKERARWRQQALDWLRADLAFWGKHINSSTPEDQAPARQKLRHWQRDPDLAGVHDENALAKLPEAERLTWVQFWSEVAALVKEPPGEK